MAIKDRGWIDGMIRRYVRFRLRRSYVSSGSFVFRAIRVKSCAVTLVKSSVASGNWTFIGNGMTLAGPASMG